MRGSRLAVLCAFAGLLLLAVVVARGSSAVPGDPPDVTIERQLPTLTDVADSTVDDAAPTTGMGRFDDESDPVRIGSLIVVLVLIAVAVLLMVLVILRARRRAKVWVEPETVDDEPGGALPARLREATERAKAELAARAGGPPGDAVVAAWLVLEEAAGRAGVAREPHQTPTEFAAVLLGEYTADVAALGELRGLYQRARFGTAPLTEDDVRRARDALNRVLAPA